MKAVRVSRPVILAGLAAGLLALGGCGQKGPLYLPNHNGHVITRTKTSDTGSAAGQTAHPADPPAQSAHPR
ncbi:MAG: LPS translocon maturation chaperone LptM [Steroidobacteraceae bacterium]